MLTIEDVEFPERFPIMTPELAFPVKLPPFNLIFAPVEVTPPFH
jgi:hypothetical protein